MEKKVKSEVVPAVRGPFLRTPYNYDLAEASRLSALICGPSLAKQSFKEECDINVIVRRFGLTGKMPQNLRMPEYGDFDEVVDYQSALNAVLAAEAEFMAIPAELRERFSNSPQRLLEFVSDPANRAEGEKLGLFKPKAVSPASPEPSGSSEGDSPAPPKG